MQDTGIVIKSYKKGEWDRRLYILFAERGVSYAHAKSAGKPKSAIFSSAQPFCLSEFTLYEGRGFVSIAEASVIRSFFGIAADYEKYHAASSIAELVGRFVMPGVPAGKSLRLMAKALSAIERGKGDAALIAAVFKLKFLQNEGLASSHAEDYPAVKAILSADDAFSIRASRAVSDIIIERASSLATRALESRLKTDVSG